MNSFIDLLRLPDDVKVQTERSPLRFEEPGSPNGTDARVCFEVVGDALRVILYPSDDPVMYLRIRFDGDQRGVQTVLGDAFARASEADLIWKAMLPQERMPWYFYALDGVRLHGYGVRTGGNAFAFWQADPAGITLWLDVRCGCDGVQLREPLVCAEIVCREGVEGETPYTAARSFCRVMCPAPNLPASPAFGFNNWYWAYGAIDEVTVLREAAYLSGLAEGCAARPFMVIDDGWQILHSKGYNGGPWNASNELFPEMADTAASIARCGCRPGIWMRPLLTMSHAPKDAILESPRQKFGTVLDPSHPFTLERVAQDVSRIAGWGYALIKHDFSTFDALGHPLVHDQPRFYDRTKTSAQIMGELYRTIQANAGSAMVMGCDTINHLAAGIHQLQRIGSDTSGRSFEWTRRDGIHSMMRLPQNGAFFQIDPDCAAFTDRVSKPLNFDYLAASAITGCATFASVKPGILTPDEEKRMNRILRTASAVEPGQGALCLDWTRTTCPSEYLFEGAEYRYDWYREHKGVRSVLTWTE